MNKQHMLALCGVAILLSGCDSRMTAVEDEMRKIQSQAALPIEAAPVFTAVPLYNYAAQPLRGPFIPESLYIELKSRSGKQIYPDLNRPAQPLESYELEKLAFKGSLKNSRGQIVGLVQTPDGQIERVQQGNYLGLDQGRIVKISPTQIDLIEIVPDGKQGYVERPRTMVLVRTGQSNKSQGNNNEIRN